MQFAKRISNVKPSPTLVLNARAKTMAAGGVSVVNLTCGEPDFDTPDHIKKAAIDAIDSGFTKYTPVAGIPPLKKAVTDSLKRDFGMSYSDEEVIVTPGAKYAIYTAINVLIEEGDEVVIPAPYWVSYPDQVMLFDGKPVIVECTDETNFKMTPSQFENVITNRTKLLILNSPSNPTGMIYSQDELKAIAEICIKNDIVVISDEIYNKIVYGDMSCPSIALVDGMKERTIVVNGASKAYAMTGWRVGYAAGPKEVISKMGIVQGQALTSITSITQKAAIAAHSGPQDVVGKMVSEFQKRRDYVINRLNSIKGISCLNPDGAFYAFPNVTGLIGKTFGNKKIESSNDLSEYLLEEAHVATVPGEAFGVDGFVRLSYATSMEELKEGLDRIEKTLNK